MAAAILSVSALIGLRVAIEFGFQPAGALRVYDVPLEYLWLPWFAAFFAVRFHQGAIPEESRPRYAAYEWMLGIAGMTANLWLVGQLWGSPLLGRASWVYWVATGSVLGIFLASSAKPAIGPRPFADWVVADAAHLLSRPGTWALTFLALAALAFGPRSLPIPRAGPAFVRWYSRQPRMPLPAAWQAAPVTLVELVDYQCPVCRSAEFEYAPLLAEVSDREAGRFRFMRVDFPLDGQCNPAGGSAPSGGLHPAACEAAAAVRLAAQTSPELEDDVRRWLWEHQASLSPASLFAGVHDTFGLDVEAHFPGLLPSIAAEAALGLQLGASGTPTFFLNGRRLGFVPASTLRAAIDLELRSAGDESSIGSSK